MNNESRAREPGENLLALLTEEPFIFTSSRFLTSRPARPCMEIAARMVLVAQASRKVNTVPPDHIINLVFGLKPENSGASVGGHFLMHLARLSPEAKYRALFGCAALEVIFIEYEINEKCRIMTRFQWKPFRSLPSACSSSSGSGIWSEGFSPEHLSQLQSTEQS